MKAGTEYQPNEQHRIRSEDIYKPKSAEVKSSSGGSTTSSAESFGLKGGHGLNPTTISTAPVIGGHSGEEFGDDYNQATGFRDASKTLYARKGDIKVTLQDFVIKKVIGRGSFGKVFLV